MAKPKKPKEDSGNFPHPQEPTPPSKPKETPPDPLDRWWDHPPQSIPEIAALLKRRAIYLRADTVEGAKLRKLYASLQDEYNKIASQVKDEFPIAYFKPSFEQSLLLNAWWCGFDFPVCFAANRIGKTTAFVINGCLWIFPNDPKWEMFAASLSPSLSDDPHKPWVKNPHAQLKYYVDLRGNPVQIIPRPHIKRLDELKDILKRYPHLIGDPTKSHLDTLSGNAEKFASLQSLLPQLSAFPHPPISENGTIWLGAPDHDFHKTIILKEWKRWLPKSSIKSFSLSDLSFVLTTHSSSNPTPTEIAIYCKSYESEDTKWSGAAVLGVILTEGLTDTVLNEIKQRIKANGFGSWDYTPYEARNAGRKTALAFKVYKGEEQLPLSAYIFTKFSARNAPSHILPTSKRDDLIRMWDGKKEGAARLDGDFYSTSPLLLSRLDRPFHALTITKEELFALYPNGQIYRGFDPGYDHPTACVWGLLTPGNKWFIFRIYSERGRTIPERCQDIITLSNNKRIKVAINAKYHTYREVHPFPNSEPVLLTAADYHLFKADEVSGAPYVNNYHNEGLLLTESTHMRPKDRVSELDRKLGKNDFLTHPITRKTPGSQVYFLINEPGVDQALHRMESLFWERLQSGPNKGEAKDEVPLHGDDELDALCYIVCAPYVHTNYQPKRINDFREISDEDEFASLQKQLIKKYSNANP